MIKTTVVAGLFSLLLVGMPRPLGAASFIDFESFPLAGTPAPQSGTPLYLQYGSWGVVFNPNDIGPPLIASGAGYPVAQTPPFVAEGPNHEFDDRDFKIDFPYGPQVIVQLYGGTMCPAATGILTAIDVMGNQVSDSKPLIGGRTATPFSIASDYGFLEVSFRAVQAGRPCDESIDNLFFDGAPPPPPPSTPPVIVLTLPGPTGDYSNRYLDVAGTIGGSELDPHMEVDLTSLDNPSGQPTMIQRSFQLRPDQTNGMNIPFTFPVVPPGLAFGHYQVVATIQNRIGDTAQATVAFTNFPAVIGSAGSLPTFRFSVADENCQVLFWQDGAEVYFPQTVPPSTMSVPLAIAEKWRVVSSPMLGPKRTLGCPLPGGYDGTFGAWKVLECERGRIYLPPDGAAVYVPGILTRALHALAPQNPQHYDLGAEFRKVGWPVSDPDDDLLVDEPTWVFQRFAQTSGGPPYQNTLEIRGRGPDMKLYVERVGGDVDELAAAGLRGNNEAPIADPEAPSIWESYPCSKPDTAIWPTDCDLGSLLVNPQSAGGQIDGTMFCGTAQPTILPEWASWNNENLDPSSYVGIIKAKDGDGPDPGSHRANIDNALNHEDCDMGFGDWVDATANVVAVPDVCEVTVVAEFFDWVFGSGRFSDIGSACFGQLKQASGEAYCRSDWNLHTRPLPSSSNWAFMAPNNVMTGDFEIEFEAQWAKKYYTRFEPKSGDMVFVHGRPIIDCGHASHNSEIHPPDTLAVSRSFVLSAGATGRPEARTTDAYVWVNGFLPEATPISLSLYAPPRPSAHAQLCVQNHEVPYLRHEPTPADQATNVLTVKEYPDPTGKLDMTFTTSHNIRSMQINYGEYLYPDPDQKPPEYQDNIQLSWAGPGERCLQAGVDY